ncbi:MAG: SCP2 sterol-binding domain-containing protein [Burkholderiales bacterium]
MRLLQLLPEAPPAHALALALNAGICLGLVSRDALEPLQRKMVSLEASDLGTRVRVAYDAGCFRAYAGSAAPDLTIRSTVSGFLALALRREDPDTLFFTRRLVMTGDTELGLIVKNLLDAIDWSRLPLPRSFDK